LLATSILVACATDREPSEPTSTPAVTAAPDISPEQVRSARNLVATRSICRLAAVAPANGPEYAKIPKEGRTPLRVTINTVPDDKQRGKFGKTAVDYVKMFEHDDTVAWMSPMSGAADLHTKAGDRIPVEVRHKDPFGGDKGLEAPVVKDEGKFSYVISPRNDYPKGTIMDILVKAEVFDPDYEEGESPWLTGRMHCGELVKTDAPGALPGGWEIQHQTGQLEDSVNQEAR
jgi:hypothetical protein